MRKRWDEWGCLVVAVLLFVVFLVLMYGSESIFDRSTYCYGKRDECLREWLSALGGWAAVAAATVTIFYLSKQIKDTERNHKLSKKIELRSLTSLAHSVVTDASRVKTIIQLNPRSGNFIVPGPSLLLIIETIMANLSSTFLDFEREVGPPESGSIVQLQQDLTSLRSVLKSGVEGADKPSEQLTKYIDGNFEKVQSYVDSINIKAKSLIADPVKFWDR